MRIRIIIRITADISGGYPPAHTIGNSASGGGPGFYNEDVAAAVLQDPRFDEAVAEFWPALKAFKGPVRVIIGTDDYVDLGPTYWPRLITAMPDAQLEIVRNAGHYIGVEQPEAFTRALRTALEDTTGR